MSDLLVERPPVYAEFIGGEIHSSNIAFDDYSRMTTQLHKLNVGRRYHAPAWALNDDDIRAVITRYMESRADFRYAQAGTDKERLERAQQKLKQKRPELVARLDRLCAQFVAAKNDGLSIRADELAQKVEETDTQLVVLEDIHKRVAGIIYFYWRCGYNSVETGAELGLKPPHVRGILGRLLVVAESLHYAPPEAMSRPHANNRWRVTQPLLDFSRGARAEQRRKEREVVATDQLARVIEMRKAGKFTVDIARELGLGANGCAVVTRLLIQAGLH